MEKIITKLLIIGCGKLGQGIGKSLAELPIEIVGIKRKLPKITPRFEILALDIFSDKFSANVRLISPDFVIYCVSSDSQTKESYQKNYVEGLRVSVKVLGQLDDFQHLFFVSSTRVYGQVTEKFLSESINPQPNEYGGRALLDAEICLKKTLFK